MGGDGSKWKKKYKRLTRQTGLTLENSKRGDEIISYCQRRGTIPWREETGTSPEGL